MMLILLCFDPAEQSYVNFKIQDINIQEMVQHHGFSNDGVVAALLPLCVKQLVLQCFEE